jgi:hypothetical protein
LSQDERPGNNHGQKTQADPYPQQHFGVFKGIAENPKPVPALPAPIGPPGVKKFKKNFKFPSVRTDHITASTYGTFHVTLRILFGVKPFFKTG